MSLTINFTTISMLKLWRIVPGIEKKLHHCNRRKTPGSPAWSSSGDRASGSSILPSHSNTENYYLGKINTKKVWNFTPLEKQSSYLFQASFYALIRVWKLQSLKHEQICNKLYNVYILPLFRLPCFLSQRAQKYFVCLFIGGRPGKFPWCFKGYLSLRLN